MGHTFTIYQYKSWNTTFALSPVAIQAPGRTLGTVSLVVEEACRARRHAYHTERISGWAAGALGRIIACEAVKSLITRYA